LADGAPISRREQAKNGRRGRIIAAAHDLLREVDAEGVNMKAIAQRAGLSAATVYNLFGSKAAILARVFDLDLADFERKLAAAGSTDSLERIFDAIVIAAGLYRSDPNFYRLTMGAPRRRPDTRLDAAVRGPRLSFWRRQVQAAIDEGRLRSETDAAALSVLLVQIASGALMDWAADAITVDQLEIETSFGFAAALASFAARSEQAGLRRRMDAQSRALAARTRAA
jgi:AcrR family transcriptional regulator